MATDIRLDENGGEWLVVDAQVMAVTGADLILDAPYRRSGRGGYYRRALVHDQADGLTLNFNGDYPGGVRVNDAQLRLHTVSDPDGLPPAQGSVGDLVMVVQHPREGEIAIREEQASLWLCVPGPMVSIRQGTSWSRIPLEQPIFRPEA